MFEGIVCLTQNAKSKTRRITRRLWQVQHSKSAIEIYGNSKLCIAVYVNILKGPQAASERLEHLIYYGSTMWNWPTGKLSIINIYYLVNLSKTLLCPNEVLRRRSTHFRA